MAQELLVLRSKVDEGCKELDNKVKQLLEMVGGSMVEDFYCKWAEIQYGR
jgi:hypothetical protein